jgi:hypothetical protein
MKKQRHRRPCHQHRQAALPTRETTSSTTAHRTAKSVDRSCFAGTIYNFLVVRSNISGDGNRFWNRILFEYLSTAFRHAAAAAAGSDCYYFGFKPLQELQRLCGTIRQYSCDPKLDLKQARGGIGNGTGQKKRTILKNKVSAILNG